MFRDICMCVLKLQCVCPPWGRLLLAIYIDSRAALPIGGRRQRFTCTNMHMRPIGISTDGTGMWCDAPNRNSYTLQFLITLYLTMVKMPCCPSKVAFPYDGKVSHKSPKTWVGKLRPEGCSEKWDCQGVVLAPPWPSTLLVRLHHRQNKGHLSGVFYKRCPLINWEVTHWPAGGRLSPVALCPMVRHCPA